MSAWIVAAVLASLLLGSLLFLVFDDVIYGVLSVVYANPYGSVLPQETKNTINNIVTIWSWLIVGVLGITIVWALNESQKAKGIV